MLLQHLHEGERPHAFLEGRRFDFRDGDNFADDSVVIGVDELLGYLDRGVIEDAVHDGLGRLRKEWRHCEQAGEGEH